MRRKIRHKLQSHLDVTEARKARQEESAPAGAGSEVAFGSSSHASGKIGFIWAGDLASSIESVEITGRLDDKKMAELIRKGVPQ